MAERQPSGAVGRRHVFGPWPDEPIVWYEGAGTSDRRFYHQDERGSTIAMTNGSGGLLSIETYDEYGVTRTTALSYLPRFAYTGQLYFSGLGIYNYKARMYSPTWGRFLQTDPIGYGDGMNMYAYVTADPVNWRDPSGLDAEEVEEKRDPPQGKKLRMVCVMPPGSRIPVCANVSDYNHDGKIDGKDALLMEAALNAVFGRGLDAVLADMRESLADATRNVVRTCAEQQGSAACQAAKDFRTEIFNAYNSLTPLPGPMQFEDVRPEAADIIFSIVGCGSLSSPAGLVVRGAGAGACARFIGNMAIPQQRRR